MKRISHLILIPLLWIVSSFSGTVTVPTEMEYCDGVKFIAQAWENRAFEKVQGKPSGKEEDLFESLVSIKGFNEQLVGEIENEIYFEAIYSKKAKNAAEINSQLKKLAEEMENCLKLKPEYLVTKNYVFYTFELGSGVEVELASSFANLEKREITLDISLQR